ncbi:glycoside hydrolase family 15 protein [Alkalilimnicola sp. S0819]|nr:glycoside hydrolase family 15 protein [Alkalilimnicola sp. S0819]MPQ17344.1 glycoside hydrolase family 15 protein [Alkalilimnicola sp. S0819]
MPDLNLGLIGNCSFAALIDRHAVVTWCCLPRLDGDPVFCSLLKGLRPGRDGSLGVELLDLARTEQHYLENTAILITTLYDRHGGVVEITDFAPRFKHYGRNFRPATLIRRIRPLAGSPRILIWVRPLFDYGSARPVITFGSNHLRYVGSSQVLRLTTNASLTAIHDEIPFLLESDLTLLLGADETIEHELDDMGRRYLNRTRDYWEEWVRYLAIPFEWQEAVIRAAITLKLNAYEDSGAIIAAVTTSIPEAPNSGRNWDYRYCWFRDAYFVINALNRLGATKTMEDYLRYIINLAAGSPELRPVYRINGRADLHESIVQALPGYRSMGPVRRGNQAYEQVQNDVYGSCILAAAHIFFDKRILRPGDEALFRRLESIGEQAVRKATEPDAGLWEFRGSLRVHSFSTLMCWAGAKTLAKIAHRLGLEESTTYWARHAVEISRILQEKAWSDEHQAFMANFGGTDLDASLLLMPELGFIRADDSRFIGTVKAIENQLRKGDFLFRYVQEDDFGYPENAFTTCTFWYIDALCAMGRRDEARALFENLLASRNPLGLLSEDLDPKTGELWGNFPQTYCMVGLINSAMRLSRPWEEAY